MPEIQRGYDARVFSMIATQEFERLPPVEACGLLSKISRTLPWASILLKVEHGVFLPVVGCRQVTVSAGCRDSFCRE
jgi:hypothetical protein